MNLDKKTIFEKLDQDQVGASIEMIPDQMRQVVKDSRLIKIPRDYSKIDHVVVNGMGGSNLGARIIKSIYKDQLRKPIIIEPGYAVPSFVGKNTLYVISSYSGTTEEPLSTYKEAKKRGAKIIGITSDNPKSKLKKLILKENLPGYIFKPEFNPSTEPRIGIGYSIFGMAALLAKAGLIDYKVKHFEDIIAEMEIRTRKLRVARPTNFNRAKKVALSIKNKIPILVASDYFDGNLHTLRNQLNESAKFFSGYLSIPELNHYAMEGLTNPGNNKKNLVFIFFSSGLTHPRIQKRNALTKQVIKKNKVDVIDIKLIGKNKISQSFEILQVGTWISYYLGIINNVNPATVPYVDWFKKQLK